MAFQNKFSISVDITQKNIVLVDTTGTGTMSNPTGYSYNGNPTPAQISTSVLTLYTPDPSTFLTSTSFLSVDLIALGFPVTGTITIPNTSFGLSATATFPDGVYLASVSEDSEEAGTTSSYSVNIIMTANTQCCIDKITSTLESCGCNDKSEKQINIMKGNLYLQSALYNTCNISKAASNLLSASEICDKSGCGGCGGC